MVDLPQRCDVVIVGGGVAGVSVAYHLARLGISDVVLLERKRLTSGTTWHAAGLVTQLRASANMTELAKYTGELFTQLEAETGQATVSGRTGRFGSLSPAAGSKSSGEAPRWPDGSACLPRC